jgi:CheY-like chemotaxis protein
MQEQQPKTFKDVLTHFDPSWVEHGYGTRFQGFQNLMRRRIRDILLVSSLYDLYVFEEDGRLYELLRNEYQDLQLTHAPEFTRVSSGREALMLVKEEKIFDLIVTTQHIEDTTAAGFARLVRQAGITIPIVLLTYDNQEWSHLQMSEEAALFDRMYMWQGDYRLWIAIIKNLEDHLNLDHDTRIAGVQSILIIEDNIRYYSWFLPLIYREVLLHARRLINEGINLSHKNLRTRARPKLLHCTSYEEACSYFNQYQENVLGVISDVDFFRQGRIDPEAGFAFAQRVHSQQPDVPILFQSSQPDNRHPAQEMGDSFLLKGTPEFESSLRQFMVENFSFGDFVFKLPDGREVGRAADLITLEQKIAVVPEECIRYHAERNHFSHWLKARTEFWLAHKLRPRQVSDFASIEEMRQDLITSLRDYRQVWQRGLMIPFRRENFDAEKTFARIGEGSIGGKARGLSFVNILINNYMVQDRFNGVSIRIPPAVVLCTGVFDEFLERNHLWPFALQEKDNQNILDRFLAAPHFPESVLDELAGFLDLVQGPLAVRSSSLLEDSQYHPFAGVYRTYMLPNNHPDPLERLRELVCAVRRVYASTFYSGPKDYMKATSFRLAEEKMAVIIQQMVGQRYGDYFYPDFSGVARSYNFYPIAPQQADDGIVSVALGLGKMVVDGGASVRICPHYPQQTFPYSRTKDILNASQRRFFALNLAALLGNTEGISDAALELLDLSAAERDGTLAQIGSTYLPEDERIVDGISRAGIRLVSFAPLLKNRLFPLPDIIDLLLGMGTWGMGTPVELEFAVNLSKKPIEFGLLQMRPLVLNRENEELTLGQHDKSDILGASRQILGHGRIQDIYDIVLVDRESFDRGKSQEAAQILHHFNSRLLSEKRPYLLIVVGRLGSLDPWLGIPVTWDQISGARAIVETNFVDFNVQPSQGSHFFQNLVSFMVSYFTITKEDEHNFLDWPWLLSRQVHEQKDGVRWLRFQEPICITMNSRVNRGEIIKPGAQAVEHY